MLKSRSSNAERYRIPYPFLIVGPLGDMLINVNLWENIEKWFIRQHNGPLP